MSLLKQIDGNVKELTMQQKTYTNVQFKDFISFLENLIINNVYDENFSRKKLNEGYLFNDNVRTGGIKLICEKHPMLEYGNAGIMTVCGSCKQLELLEAALDQYADYDDKQEDSVEIDIQYHDELNPELWEDVDGTYNLEPDVATTLRRAAEAFYLFLKVPKVEVIDTTVTGSSANYNWTESSDIDLHIIVSFEKAEKLYGPIIQEYFDTKRTVWNDTHDIKIKDMPVEFYVQDVAEKHYSTGVYSVETNDWVKEPKHQPPEIDDTAVEQKAKRLMSEIDRASQSNKASVLEVLMEKIKRMRKDALSVGGEWATGNLVFKILRREGYIDKLVENKRRTFDRALSIEDEEFSDLLK